MQKKPLIQEELRAFYFCFNLITGISEFIDSAAMSAIASTSLTQLLSVRSLTRKEQVLFGLILLFFITLFFKLGGINVVVTALIVIYSFASGPIKEKWELLKERMYIQAMLLFFLYMVGSTLFSENLGQGLRHLELRLPLILFPLSLGLLSLSRSFIQKVLISFALLTTAVCLICLVASVFKFFQVHRTDVFFNDNLTLVLRRQSIYIALLVTFSIYILGYFLFFRQTSSKFLLLLAVVFLFGISFLLASRISLAALVMVTIGFSLYYIFSRKKILEGLALIFGLLIGVFLINKFLPQTFNRYKELAYTKFDYSNTGPESHFNVKASADQWNGANFRMAAWACGWEVFKENPVFGVGLGDKDEELLEKYRQKNFVFAIETNKNVHSNYLDILFSLGVIGLLLFLAAWLILPLWQAAKTRNGLTMLIILTFALAWITEVYFSRSMGNMLVGFFIPFLLSSNPVLDEATHAEPDAEPARREIFPA